MDSTLPDLLQEYSSPTREWRRVAAELYGSEEAFSSTHPVGRWLSSPDQDETDALAVPAAGSFGLDESFLVEIYVLGIQASCGPTPATSFNRALSILYVPEVRLGDWVLGKCFRLAAEDDVACDIKPGTWKRINSDMIYEPHEALSWKVVPFALQLASPQRLFSIFQIHQDKAVQVVKIGERAAYDSYLSVISDSGHIKSQSRSWVACEFCRMRARLCQCPSVFRDRAFTGPLPHQSSWSSWVEDGRQCNTRGFFEMMFQVSNREGKGPELTLPVQETIKYHFCNSSPQLTKMRSFFALKLFPFNIAIDLRLVNDQGPDDPIVDLLDLDTLLELESEMPALGTGDNAIPSICHAPLRLDSSTDLEALTDSYSSSTKMLSLETDQNLSTLAHKPQSKYTCAVCGRGPFRNNSNLTRHMREHKGQMSFACDACGKTFTQRANLMRHVAALHLGLKPFACNACPLKFATKANLVRHVSARHNTDL